MKSLTLEQKIGQMLVIGFNGLIVPTEIKDLIETYHIGGIILFGRNIGTPIELLTLTTELQQIAKNAGYQHPLLICLDQENGVVRRLGEGTTIFPGSMLLGATQDKANAYNIGYATGVELKALGINWNLAPVMDVNNNPNNPVIGVRSFGESPDLVGELGTELMRGMQDAGVITTLKHFPGHGDTNVDSHLDLPVISHTIERLKEVELKPFIKGIKQGADTIMTAHVYFPAIEKEENRPATLSNSVITGLLRDKLQFNGVVTTDCMEMNAIANGVGTEKGAVEAVKAGADFIMVSHTMDKQVGSIQAILKAVQDGEIDESRIDLSVERITKLKEKYTSWDEIQKLEELQVPDVVGSKEHQVIAETAYQQGITVVKNENALIPIKEEQRVLAVYPNNGTTMMVEDKKYAGMNLGEIVQQYDPNAEYMILSNPPTKDEINQVIERSQKFDRIIIGTLSVSEDDNQAKLVNRLLDKNANVICVALRNPYDLAYFSKVSTYLCTYEFTKPAMEYAVKTIYGLEKVSGTLPVTIPFK